MSLVIGQRAQKLAVEDYKQDNVKLKSKLNLEVRHVKVVPQNNGNATYRDVLVSMK